MNSSCHSALRDINARGTRDKRAARGVTSALPVCMLNHIGKRVSSQIAEKTRTVIGPGSFKDKKDINVSNLSKGIYFIKAKTENGIVSKKLVVN